MKKLATLIIVSILLGNQFLYPSRLAYADDETASTPPIETESDVPVTPPSDSETTVAPVDTPTEEVVPETTNATDEVIATTTDEITASTTEATSTGATTTDTEIVATSTESTETIEATSTPETETTSNVTETSTTTIVSGQAVALANILNIINTNFLNSTGVIFFANFFDYLKETLDLRTLLGGDTACVATPCTSGDELSINMSSDATINNDILIDAETGNNTIDNTGSGTIDTGNAYAGLNLVNLANNNFVDTNYLLVTLNAFNGVGGDIVFPSLDQFLNSLSNGATSPNAIDLESQAEINNNVNLETNSGDNQTSDTATSTITTGDAHSSSNVFNQINTNVASDNRVSILFRIHGNWAGQIFGAPAGLNWMQGPDGSIYMFDSASSTASGNSSGQTDITNTSHALINNNVSVIALTGENQIDGASTALISTGDAYAGANIVNVANSNVVGKNWILAIINIFGDFTGNIAFGRPDLWVGEQVETPTQVKNGGELTYKFTVINNGDSPSSNTILTNDYDANHLEIINSSIPYQKNDQGELTWDLGTLPAGAATELNYQARIINADDNGTIIDNTAKVSGHETDNNDTDNTDMVTITTDTIQHGGSSGSRIRNRVSITANNSNTATSTDKRLEVTRDNLATILNGNQNISHQKLVVKNPSDKPIDAVILHDILKNSSDQIIKDEAWNLGTILAHEEITIGYDIQFSTDAPGGLYTLTTTFDQFRNDNIPNGYILLNKSTPKPAILTSATVEPEPEPEPEPTSTSTPAVTPQVAMVAAVDNSKTGNVPRIPLALPAILTMASIGIWGSYRRKLMI